MMEKVHINSVDNCEYCDTSYWEHDTGYREYSCDLFGCECVGDEDCPLTFKFKVRDQ